MEDERGTTTGTPGDHVHGHDHGQEKDPAEQEALARDLGDELTDIFTRYVRGEVDFADLTFLTFETLQDLHIIASGEYEVEYEDDEEAASGGDEGGVEGGYDEASATEEQEELAQEPAGR